MSDRINVKEASITSEDAVQLLIALNDVLTQITDVSGAAGFAAEDVADARSVFVIAYISGEALGCGALRKLSEHSAEIKRVFARPNRIGVGSAIVKTLEEKARFLGYTELFLETRKVNTAAVAFYQKLGYQTCPNYGKYVGRMDAICLSKVI